MTRSHSSKPGRLDRSQEINEKGGNSMKHSKAERNLIFLQSLKNRLKNHQNKVENLKLSNKMMLKKVNQLNSQIAYNNSEIAVTENLIKNLSNQISLLESQSSE